MRKILISAILTVCLVFNLSPAPLGAGNQVIGNGAVALAKTKVGLNKTSVTILVNHTYKLIA